MVNNHQATVPHQHPGEDQTYFASKYSVFYIYIYVSSSRMCLCSLGFCIFKTNKQHWMRERAMCCIRWYEVNVLFTFSIPFFRRAVTALHTCRRRKTYFWRGPKCEFYTITSSTARPVLVWRSGNIERRKEIQLCSFSLHIRIHSWSCRGLCRRAYSLGLFPPGEIFRTTRLLFCTHICIYECADSNRMRTWGIGGSSVLSFRWHAYSCYRSVLSKLLYFVAACIVRYSSPGYAFAALFTFTRVLRNAQIKTLNRWRVYTYTMGCWLCIHLRFCQLSARIYISNRILISVGRSSRHGRGRLKYYILRVQRNSYILLIRTLIIQLSYCGFFF